MPTHDLAAHAPHLAELVESATARYDAASPHVYGAGLPSLGALDMRGIVLQFFAKQVVGKFRDAVAGQKEEIAQAVADKAKQAVEYLIDQGLGLTESFGG